MKTKFALALPVTFAALLALSADQANAQTSTPGKTGPAVTCPYDDDGDGIPNRTDPDHVRPCDGSGHRFGKGSGVNRMQRGAGWYGARRGNGVCDGTGPKGYGGRR